MTRPLRAIHVARRGRVTVNYTGTDPVAGDYLVTSTTGGSAQAQTSLRPEIFAVCLSAGSSGSVKALLLTQRTFNAVANDADILRIAHASSTSDFQATISGAPTSTSVVYTGVSGAEYSFAPYNSNQLGKFVLHNLTRGTSRLVTAVDTATNTITTEASTDTWADTDSISMRSLTNTNVNNSGYFYDVDLDNDNAGTLFASAIAFQAWVYHYDTGSPDNDTAVLGVHPYDTFAGSKFLGVYTGEAGIWLTIPLTIPLIDKKWCIRLIATGTNTGLYIVRLQGIWEATP